MGKKNDEHKQEKLAEEAEHRKNWLSKLLGKCKKDDDDAKNIQR